MNNSSVSANVYHKHYVHHKYNVHKKKKDFYEDFEAVFFKLDLVSAKCTIFYETEFCALLEDECNERAKNFRMKLDAVYKNNDILTELSTPTAIKISFWFSKTCCWEDKADFITVGRERLRALLVEDEPINQKIAALMLRKIGFSVDIAANGKEALELAKKNYDFIFMDIGLPDIDGYEVSKEIRKRGGKNAQVPIIAVTAHAFAKADDNQNTLIAIDEIVEKPIKPKELRDMIKKYL